MRRRRTSRSAAVAFLVLALSCATSFEKPKGFDAAKECELDRMEVPTSFRGKPVRDTDRATIADVRGMADAWKVCFNRLAAVAEHNRRVAVLARCDWRCELRKAGMYAGLTVLLEVLVYLAAL